MKLGRIYLSQQRAKGEGNRGQWRWVKDYRCCAADSLTCYCFWDMKINNCSHFVGMSLFCSSPSFTEDEELFSCGLHCRKLYFLIIFCFLPLYKSYVYFLLWFQDTGKLNVSYFRFDINDATGDLDANRPVPFRLTPNISEFLTTIGVSGPLTASMIAVARCFAQPNFKVPRLLPFFLFKYIT